MFILYEFVHLHILYCMLIICFLFKLCVLLELYYLFYLLFNFLHNVPFELFFHFLLEVANESQQKIDFFSYFRISILVLYMEERTQR